jgi:hypothetical protein
MAFQVTTYKVKLVSETNAGILLGTMVAIALVGMALFAPQGIHGTGAIILILVVGFSIAIFSWQRFVTGRTEWTVDNTQILITWTKSFAFTTCNEITIRWDEIKDIRERHDPHYCVLKIEMASGEEWKFIHDYMVFKDDFTECLIRLYWIFGEKHGVQQHPGKRAKRQDK